MKILVRMPNWVGDLVMATPVLADLRRAYPEASITAMALSSMVELLREDRSIDALFPFHRHLSQLEKGDDRSIIAKIKAGQYDLGILLPNSFSSAWWFWQGKVKRKIGYSSFSRRFLLTDRVELPEEKMHQVDRYKRLLLPLGIRFSETRPKLIFSQKEIEEAKLLLFRKGYVEGANLVGIHPGAAYGSAKCWPPDRYRELALALVQENLFVVFFGDARASGLISEICLGLPSSVINLAGETSIRELSCLIHDCDVFVTNDSGPMHIAAAVGTPLVALFGSTDDAVTGPYGNPLSVINKKVSCSPCLKRVCPIDFRCMMQISVGEVKTKVLHHV